MVLFGVLPQSTAPYASTSPVFILQHPTRNIFWVKKLKWELIVSGKNPCKQIQHAFIFRTKSRLIFGKEC